MEVFDEIQAYLPFLIPLIGLQVLLSLTALIMLIRQNRVHYMNKLLWALIIILFNLIGPILYFVLEKRA
ncbi:MAG TPA: PLDc N-terminal domain-containing protein [Aliicoccus persicus]|uniref:PLDc N-terminal domain-containing protein n=1 Tax=Aliicoccus persicus TaxID=930138 RepID=A0A921DX40_9STAP|nr:PLDc N-terminal domain-containing protein [Aliicoccus persicus]